MRIVVTLWSYMRIVVTLWSYMRIVVAPRLYMRIVAVALRSYIIIVVGGSSTKQTKSNVPTNSLKSQKGVTCVLFRIWLNHSLRKSHPISKRNYGDSFHQATQLQTRNYSIPTHSNQKLVGRNPFNKHLSTNTEKKKKKNKTNLLTIGSCLLQSPKSFPNN